MSSISISLNDNRLAYLPGERVEGAVSWSFTSSPPGGAIEVRLFWHTRGKGTQDIGIVRTARFDDAAAAAQGERTFGFDLPDGPYSFSGKLISLIWAVEAVAEELSEAARAEIIVSPTYGEVQLGTAEES